jgi:16S rRNA (guanine527-N7)-methyltransferase
MDNTNSILEHLGGIDKQLSVEMYAAKLSILLDMLKEWNDKFNLTSITQDGEVIIKHFVDSLMLVKSNNSKPWHTLIDIGTGAGFPGLPLAIIYPNREIFLSDANGKKILFLRQVKEELSLANVTIIHGRSEDLSRNSKLRDSFDAAAMRALSAFPIALELSAGLVKTGGQVLYYASSKQAQEINKQLDCFKELGCELAGSFAYELPENMGSHSIISVNKLWKTPFKYPRPYGVIKKKPL